MKLKLNTINTSLNGGNGRGKGRRFFSQFALFLGAVMISFLIWIVLYVQQKTVYTIRVDVDYSQIDTKYYLPESHTKYIQVDVQDKVFNLIDIYNKDLSITATLPTKINDSYYVQMDKGQFEDEISALLPPSTQISKIYPSTINIPLKEKNSKKVPINTDLNVSVKSGYISYPIKVFPSYINIYGDKKLLDGINSINIKTPPYTDLSDTTSFEAKVILPDGVTTNFMSVKVVIPIEMISQMQLTLPIEVVGQPIDKVLYPLPSKAQLTVSMPISKLLDLKNNSNLRAENEFVIGVKYPKKSLEDDDSQLDIELIEAPEWVISYTTNPARVQYIIKTK